MKFKTPDGEMLTGRSYDEVVAAMASLKLSEPKSIDTYRRATARRASSQYAVVIDATDNRSFVRSLVAAGLLESV